MIAIPIRAVPFLLILIVCLAAPGWAQSEKVSELILKAQRGDAQAQHHLGLLYHLGQGVPWDYGEAEMWLRKAANQGLAAAQFTMGLMYDTGEGAPQDYGAAHKWYSLAASRSTGEKREKAIKHRERLAALMMPAEIAEAQRAAWEWFEQFSSKK